MQKIHMFHLCNMKGHETIITFHQKTWRQTCLVLMLSALKKVTVFMKLTTFFVSRTKQIYTKALAVSESLIKIKAMPPWALFETLLTWVVICKQRFLHENEMCNIFKSRNTKTLIMYILENLCKLLQTPWKTTTLRQPIHFSGAVQFLATFYV